MGSIVARTGLLLLAAPLCQSQDWESSAGSTTLPQAPLDLQYPVLLKCDPRDTRGCISRCNKGVIGKQVRPSDMLCRSILCVVDCARLTSRGCPAAATRACEMLISSLKANGVQDCFVGCSTDL
ncbi:unnamed protein product [Polarella glacialis]|uniref:Uncharacterized protein n=1 Tax=Polarella glacialis TaxID=89957 RepID=A0A813GCD4_POLGL|nr:unnamed protein product [Polarella glacialis]